MSRRQRRAETAKISNIQSADDIPMRKPESVRNQKNVKTLLEIAQERQAQLGLSGTTLSQREISEGNLRQFKITSDGKVVDIASGEEVELQQSKDDESSPWWDTLFLASSLSAIHFTLEFLTVHQYAQEIRFPPIIIHTLFVAFPTMFLMIHLFHGHLLKLPSVLLSERAKSGLKVAQQILLLIVANVAGCYLIHLTNDRGYYAVMKNAPSIGTLWVWSVLELGLLGALAGVIGPGIYAWYHGHRIY